MRYEEDKIILELERVKNEHRSIDATIAGLSDAQGGFDQIRMQRLKKQKLQLRDVISRLESQLHPDITA